VSDLIYYLQAGDGAVRIDTCHETRLRMCIGQLQAGNPDLLLVRALYKGDTSVLTELRHHHRAHRIHDTWHTATVLDELPEHLEPVEFDSDAERRKVAVRTMQTLSLQART
jgi:hypothetical protein